MLSDGHVTRRKAATCYQRLQLQTLIRIPIGGRLISSSNGIAVLASRRQQQH
jgi:hypothetical protein